MDQRLFEIIACPVCHGKLSYAKQQQELVCKVDHLAYPIVDDIPVLLEEQARHLNVDEYPS